MLGSSFLFDLSFSWRRMHISWKLSSSQIGLRRAREPYSVSSVSSSKALIPLEEEAAWVADALGPPSGEGGSYTSAMRTPKRNEELVVAGGDVHVSRQTCR